MSRRYPERPIVAVGALIIKDDKALLVRRATQPLKGKWTLPGGAVGLGETLADAVRREIKEEVCLDIAVGDIVGVFDRIYPDAAGTAEYHYVLIDYLCTVSAGQPRAASDVEAARWFARAEIEAMDMPPFTKELILRHLQ